MVTKPNEPLPDEQSPATRSLGKIACIQINAEGDLETRLEKVAQYCQEAASKGAKLAVLPENFAYFGQPDTSKIADIESANGGVVRKRLADIAANNQLWLVGGTLPLWLYAEHEKNKKRSGITSCTEPEKPPFASTLVFSNQGEELYRYNKNKLFNVSIPEQNFYYRESDTYSPGDGETLVFDSPIGRVGVVVCFDLRFPGLILQMVKQGAEIIVAPSAFTRETGEVHWRLLLQARALDSLCYVAGSNLAGRCRPKKATWGGSAIVDPWGKVIAEMADEEGIILAGIDLEKQKKIRKRMPLFD